MKLSERMAYLATMAYADVFNFPLTADELLHWLIFYQREISRPKEVLTVGRFLTLSDRAELIKVRRRRLAVVAQKMEIARKLANLLKLVPTIKLVGVTGGLAMGNAEPSDDIDFFLITAKGTLWLSRFLATLVIETSGRRRRPGQKQVKNSICLNMFMTEDHLKLPKSDQDLFAAHEVLQMAPLWERGGTYQKFLGANSWVKEFLPNAWKESVKRQALSVKFGKTKKHLLHLLEQPTKWLQLWYMRRHRTTEVVTDTLIRFHPVDARVWVKQAFARRLRHLNIPLDKVFYNR